MKNKNYLIMILLNFLSKILGFFREVCLAFFYGASGISDAYLVALNIPVSLWGIFTVGITSGYIPMYNRIYVQSGREEAEQYTNGLINCLLIISVIVVFITEMFAPYIIYIVAPGLEYNTMELAVFFLRISIFIIFVFSSYNILLEYLKIKKEYIYPTLVGTIFNICVVFGIILSAYFDVPKSLVIGSFIAYIIQLMLLIPRLKQVGYRYSKKILNSLPHIKRMAVISIPVIIGTSINEINVMVDQNFASRLYAGGITVLNYSSKLNAAIQGVIFSSFMVVFFPLLSKEIEKCNGALSEKAKKYINETIKKTSCLTIPLMAILICNAELIINVLFKRGAFTDNDVIVTGICLRYYSLGLIAVAYREIFSKVFYALHNTKAPMMSAGVGLIVNIILNFILSEMFGLVGLAMASSISIILITVLIYIQLHKSVGGVICKETIIEISIVSIVSVFIGMFSRFMYGIEIHGAIYQILLCCIFPMIICYVLIFLYKNKIRYL